MGELHYVRSVYCTQLVVDDQPASLRCGLL